MSVLFADVAGSSLLYAERGDAVAFRIMSGCLDLLERQVVRHGGRVVKRAGDGVLAVFETAKNAESAVRAAEAMQQALGAAAQDPPTVRLHVRVGISRGTPVHDGTDVYGDVVNVAARLVALAGPDEIFLSGDLYEQLPKRAQKRVRLVDRLVLHGRPAEVPVYEYQLAQGSHTAVVDHGTARPVEPLEVLYGPRCFIVGPDRPKLRIGRNDDNDIAIVDDEVSRYHAEVVVRGKQFFLVDRSTNGTFVRTAAGETLRVLRGELMLLGSGEIVVGSDSVQPIRYRYAAA